MTNNCARIIIDIFCKVGTTVNADLRSFAVSSLLNAADALASNIEHSSDPETASPLNGDSLG